MSYYIIPKKNAISLLFPRKPPLEESVATFIYLSLAEFCFFSRADFLFFSCTLT